MHPCGRLSLSIRSVFDSLSVSTQFVISTVPCGPLRVPPPACQKEPDEGGCLAVCPDSHTINRTAKGIKIIINGYRDCLVVVAGPHKQGLWVNVGTGWRSEPNGQPVHTGTTTAVMARRKARQRA